MIVAKAVPAPHEPMPADGPKPKPPAGMGDFQNNEPSPGKIIAPRFAPTASGTVKPAQRSVTRVGPEIAQVYEDDKAKGENRARDAGRDESQVRIASVDLHAITVAYNNATKEMEKGNMAEAKRLYLAILADQPRHVETLNNLGVIAMKEENAKEAMFFFGKVLEYDKSHGKAYNNLGLLAMKEGNIRLAEEYFRKAIEMGRNGVEPSLNLAALLRGEGRYGEASTVLEGLLKGGVRNRYVHLSYALIKDDMNQYDEAIKYYTLFLRDTAGKEESREVAERIKAIESAQSLRGRP